MRPPLQALKEYTAGDQIGQPQVARQLAFERHHDDATASATCRLHENKPFLNCEVLLNIDAVCVVHSMAEPVLPDPDIDVPQQGASNGRLEARWLTRVHLAFLMVFASALGAVVAFWAATIEQKTSQLQSQLTLGRMVEISERHRIANDVAVRTALEQRQKTLRTKAEERHKIADQIRNEAPEEAARLDILGQQEFSLARTVNGLIYPLRELGPGDSTQQRLSEAASRHLIARGMGHIPDLGDITGQVKTKKEIKAPPISFNETTAKLNLQIWQRIERMIEIGHTKVPLLALGVVLIVSSLVFFTISDLNDHRRVIANLTLFAGLFVLLAAIVYVALVEPTVWFPLLIVMAVSIVFGIIGWRNGILKPHEYDIDTPQPNELQPRSFVGAHMFLRTAPHNLSRWTVVFVAVTVFLSALVGYWYSKALTNAHMASHHAFASQVALNNRSTERNLVTSAGGAVLGLEVLQARIECAFSSQNALFISEQQTPSLADVAKLQRDTVCDRLKDDNLVKIGKRYDDIGFDTAQNPTGRYYTLLYYDRTPNPAQLFALADGYLELSDSYEQKSTTFLLSITLFAIALYLFGQSLGMGTGLAARALTYCGVLLAGLSIGLAGLSKATPVGNFKSPDATCKAPENLSGWAGPQHSIELAAYFYGKAKPKYRIAQDGAEYGKAAAVLDCVTSIRRNFAIAQGERARAHSKSNTVERDSTFISLSTKSALPKKIEAEHNTMSALDANGWSPSPIFLDGVGFSTTLHAFATGNRAALAEAERLLEQGIKIGKLEKAFWPKEIAANQKRPIWHTLRRTGRSLHFNLGLARLARGNIKGAQHAYDVALNVFGFYGPGGKSANTTPSARYRKHLVAALTDLNILVEYCSLLYKNEKKEQCPKILQGALNVKQRVIGALSGLGGKVSKAKLTNASLHLAPSRASWQARIDGFDPETDHVEVVWYVLDSKEWNVWRAVQGLFKAAPKISYDTRTKIARAHVDYETPGTNCIPAGTYKAEFYVNGKLVQNLKTGTLMAPEYVTYRSRELNMSLCHPKTWRKRRAADDLHGRHLVRGFSNEKGKGAAYLFTFFAVRHPAPGPINDVFVGRAWTWLKQILKKVPTDDQFQKATAKFKGCGQPISRGTLLHKAWIMPDGTAHVAFVVGDFAKDGEACRVLNSIGNYYNRGDANELQRL